MTNKYRVDWKSGMRLTDETFRAADDFYISYMEPLYAVLVNGNYGFLNLPLFRYEISESSLSLLELDICAITFSGKLIHLSFKREERNIFQNISLPNSCNSIIVYIDKTSDKTIPVIINNGSVPYCDADYKIIIKEEQDNYNNPDAVPLARFVYNNGWFLDSSFIAPCITLRGNASLLRYAANYLVDIKLLINHLKARVNNRNDAMSMSILSNLIHFGHELDKEAELMSPRHFICIMQEIIDMFLILGDTDKYFKIPEIERCIVYKESHFTPFEIYKMIEEGQFLTHIIINACESTSNYSEQKEELIRIQRKIHTDSIRKKHH